MMTLLELLNYIKPKIEHMLVFMTEFVDMWMMKLCENVLESVMNRIVLSFEP
jgi:hypothetical protein